MRGLSTLKQGSIDAIGFGADNKLLPLIPSTAGATTGAGRVAVPSVAREVVQRRQ